VIFDLGPKECLHDLYDRVEERRLLHEALSRKEKLVVVYGLRRVGKTSLVKAVLNEKEFSYIFIDAKGIYYEYGSMLKGAIISAVSQKFLEFIGRLGFGPGDAGQVTADDLTLTQLLGAIDEWCSGKKLFLVIAIDEAQYLRFGGRTRYDGIMAWSIDNLKNIGYVLTGSEIGMLKDFLKIGNADAPLYGRFKDEIYLERFDAKASAAFLKRGFEELSTAVKPDEIDGAVARIDGTAGWLTYYGHYRAVMKMGAEPALSSVFEEGSRLVAGELNALIRQSRKRYVAILKAVAEGIDKWSDIKPYVVAKSGKVSDTILNSLLQTLVKLGILEKADGSYKIGDPVLLYAIKAL
jgi:hypothetical protein